MDGIAGECLNVTVTVINMYGEEITFKNALASQHTLQKEQNSLKKENAKEMGRHFGMGEKKMPVQELGNLNSSV